jgi:hypothetical protein
MDRKGYKKKRLRLSDGFPSVRKAFKERRHSADARMQPTSPANVLARC